jgi:hypothetical protein
MRFEIRPAVDLRNGVHDVRFIYREEARSQLVNVETLSTDELQELAATILDYLHEYWSQPKVRTLDEELESGSAQPRSKEYEFEHDPSKHGMRRSK